jgi:pteridine reductase
MPYLLSKQVLAMLTRQMALEWAPRIAVNAVAPGLILAPDGAPPEAMRRLLEGVPMGRQGEPDDVAEAVVFLAASRFITGQTIFVDGGRHLRGTERTA